MYSSLKLPLRFDPCLLQQDFHAIPPEEWTPHYNEHD